VQKELKEIDRDKASGVTIQITEGNLQKLTGFVEGPKDTAYEGGYFVVGITLGRLTLPGNFGINLGPFYNDVILQCCCFDCRQSVSFCAAQDAFHNQSLASQR